MDLSDSQSQEFFIQWHLTERCNLRCLHCYQSSANFRELSLGEITETAAEIREMLAAWEDAYGIGFSKSYTITGGEPFLRADLFEVLETAGSAGFGVFLLSNGTLIKEREAWRLAELGVEGVQVSLEGPGLIHDRIRGHGSFEAALRGVRSLIEAGVVVNLNVTLSSVNADYIGELVSIAGSLGAKRISFSRLVPCGRGSSLAAEVLEPQRVRDIYEDLFSLRVPGLVIGSGDPIASQLRAEPGPSGGCTAAGGCAAGVSGLTIMADGSISPCRRLGLTIGNVRTDSLREVWAASPVLEALRDKTRYTGRCGECDRWSDCRGCRAVAYAHALSQGSDDYLGDDPQCFFE
jgi:MoaA/NifB/PqqE/SkfB family radical SAM enzyme